MKQITYEATLRVLESLKTLTPGTEEHHRATEDADRLFWLYNELTRKKEPLELRFDAATEDGVYIEAAPVPIEPEPIEEPAVEPAPAPAAEEPAPIEPEPAHEETPAYSESDVRKALAQARIAGVVVSDIIAKYSTTGMRGLQPCDYAKVMADLKEAQ